MYAPEVLDDTAVIKGEIIPIVLFIGEPPTLSRCDLLHELHDDRFAVNQDSVKVKYDGA